MRTILRTLRSCRGNRLWWSHQQVQGIINHTQETSIRLFILRKPSIRSTQCPCYGRCCDYVNHKIVQELNPPQIDLHLIHDIFSFWIPCHQLLPNSNHIWSIHTEETTSTSSEFRSAKRKYLHHTHGTKWLRPGRFCTPTMTLQLILWHSSCMVTQPNLHFRNWAHINHPCSPPKVQWPGRHRDHSTDSNQKPSNCQVDGISTSAEQQLPNDQHVTGNSQPLRILQTLCKLNLLQLLFYIRTAYRWPYEAIVLSTMTRFSKSFLPEASGVYYLQENCS